MDEGKKTISGEGDEDEKMVVVRKTLGLREAMAKAALPDEEDLSSKKKNGAVTEEDSNCILSQKGNS